MKFEITLTELIEIRDAIGSIKWLIPHGDAFPKLSYEVQAMDHAYEIINRILGIKK